jgi:hypothetical protein
MDVNRRRATIREASARRRLPARLADFKDLRDDFPPLGPATRG